MSLGSNFLWGAYSPAYSVEGGGTNADWFDWECSRPGLVPNIDGADSANRFESDVRLAADLGLNAISVGIEWSRLQPAARETSSVATDRYRRMIEAAQHAGLTCVVTLNHRTLPRWVGANGGWANPDTAKLFAEFAETVGETSASHAEMIWTMVEPNTVAVSGYADGSGPPGKSDPEAFSTAVETLGSAHRLAYEALKMARPNLDVGIVVGASMWVAEPGYEQDLEKLRGVLEDPFWDIARDGDFVGVLASGRVTVGAESRAKKGDRRPPARIIGRVNDPAVATTVARRAHSMTSGLPIYVVDTYSGPDDSLRAAHITSSAQSLFAADVDYEARGWFYAPLLDSNLWGQRSSTGLIEVDPYTFARSVRPSADRISDVAHQVK